jgi:hypothetical protein
MSDAAKLLLAGQLIGGNVRKIIAFADDSAASWFRGRSWMAEALRAMSIEVQVVSLPDGVRASIVAAQQRQYR